MKLNIKSLTKFKKNIIEHIDKCISYINENCPDNDAKNNDMRSLDQTIKNYNRLISVYNNMKGESNSDNSIDDSIYNNNINPDTYYDPHFDAQFDSNYDRDYNRDYETVYNDNFNAEYDNICTKNFNGSYYKDNDNDLDSDECSRIVSKRTYKKQEYFNNDSDFSDMNNLKNDKCDNFYSNLSTNIYSNINDLLSSDNNGDRNNYNKNKLTFVGSDNTESSISSISFTSSSSEQEDDDDNNYNFILNNKRKTLISSLTIPLSDIEIVSDDTNIDYDIPIV